MKRLIFLCTITLLLSPAKAQVAHYYPILEHFTNTRCSLCPTPNGALYAYIDQHPQAFHHVSYHPSVPYVNCFLYQANTAGNLVRQVDYNVNFTPQSYLNGKRAFTAGGLLNVDSLSAVSGLTAPVRIELDLRLNDALPKVIALIDKFDASLAEGNKLFVALVEEPVAYNAPNGETVHRDVFRTWLTPEDGYVLNFGASAQHFWVQDFEPGSNWDLSKLYALAFIQSGTSAQILNSGASYDVKATVSVAGANAQVAASGGIPPYTYAWSDGQQGNTASGLAAGNYVVRITDSVDNYYEVAFTSSGVSSIDDLTATLGLKWFFEENIGSLRLMAQAPLDQPLTLRLIDLAGKTLAVIPWERNTKDISWKIPPVASGVYVVQIEGNEGRTALKWVRP